MNHAEYLVDLVDKTGAVVGGKKRREINKAIDLYHTVFVILCTPDRKLILSKIPSREDLPNRYSAKLGATVATIRRHKESPEQASRRAVKSELLVDDVHLRHLEDTYLELPDGHATYASIYCGTCSAPKDFSRRDIEQLATFSQDGLDNMTRQNGAMFAPTFLAIWRKYREKLFSI